MAAFAPLTDEVNALKRQLTDARGELAHIGIIVQEAYGKRGEPCPDLGLPSFALLYGPVQQAFIDLERVREELNARRAAMKHADDLGMDVDAVAKLICPPPCETCGGRPPQFNILADSVTGIFGDCPTCHGRPKWTLHDRLDAVERYLRHYDVVDDLADGLTEILADVAKVTP